MRCCGSGIDPTFISLSRVVFKNCWYPDWHCDVLKKQHFDKEEIIWFDPITNSLHYSFQSKLTVEC